MILTHIFGKLNLVNKIKHSAENRYIHIRYTEDIENLRYKMIKTSVQIIELMKENPVIKMQEIATRLGLSKRAVEMQVKKILEHGNNKTY